jgi:alkanesulfonate monooxygenase SsuD/methylene tetrahydromethanopterin reductase-like flavin-dependent oxidoreductase (luciferase family)
VTERALKIGVILPMFSGDPGKVVAAARSAESLGFDGAFAFDHFFPPGGPPDRPALEAFTTLAAVAAVTERVRLGTLVTRAVLRPAGLLAKMMATIDVVSGGRVIVGIGTGDPIDRPEHDAFGFPDLGVRARRAHLAETVTAIKALFAGQAFPGGEYVPRLTGPLVPAPVQVSGPPVWLGAQSDEIVRMAGSIADGWNGWGLAPDAFRHKAKLLAEEAERAGRQAEPTWAGIVLLGEDERDVERLLESRHRRGMTDDLAWSGPVDRFGEHLHDLAEAGATWVIMVLAGPSDRRELFAERALPSLG